jgi:excisionase family DNA binding protein
MENNAIKEDHLFTIQETATYMRISRRTLSRHAKSGKINSLRAGKKYLFTKSEIDRFLGNFQPTNTQEEING